MNQEKPAAAPKPITQKPADAKKSKLKFNFNSKTIRLLLMAGIAISVLAFLAATAVGLSILKSKSNSMVELKVKSQTADAQLSNLEKAKKQVQKYAYFKDVAKTVIPTDKNQAEDIIEINRVANEAGISIQSITFPTSTLGLTTSTTSSTSSADATSSSSSKTAISQAKPVTGIPGLYSLELTITPESASTAPTSKQLTYAKMLDFLNRIENNRHTAQITEVDITPSGTGNSILGSGFTFVLKLNIFIKP
jgi:hypothetical protein